MNGSNKSEATTAVILSSEVTTTTTTHQKSSNGSTELPTVVPQNEIFTAAQYGDWQRIEVLLKEGKANAKDKNEQGITPLHWAAINDRLLACKVLLDNGAEVNASGGDLAATPMMWAAKNGHVYIVHLLMTYGGDPALLDNQGYNVLQLATHSSNIMLVIYLLHADIPVDSIDPQGHTCLMWAAYQGDALSVDAYLKWGANVNAKDNDGLHALHWAIVRGNRQCIRRIIEEGGDLSARQNENKDARDLAKELKTIKSFESALDSVGRDPETGLRRTHWLTTEMSMKVIFSLPCLYLGVIVALFARAPIMLSLPIALLIMYGMQRLSSSVVTPPSLRTMGVHKTPYLAGIFTGSAIWTTVHWIFVLLPSIWSIHPWLNLAFGIIFSTCMYNFFVALAIDPGFLPRVGGRTEQRDAIEELLRDGEYDSQHFCVDCLLRRPLRSKHCKICQRCVARHDHHCPWVSNCIGIRNHRNFITYIVALFVGIPLYAYLVSLSLEVRGLPTDPVECTLLAESYCAWIQIDGFGIILAAWDCLQMTWVTMLVLVQSWQIARATTTQEVVNLRRHGFMGGSGVGSLSSSSPSGHARRVPATTHLASVVAGGSTDPATVSLDAEGDGPLPLATCEHHDHDHHPSRRAGGAGAGGIMGKVSRLLGVDQFVDTAREGLFARRRKGRGGTKRYENPFDGGVVSNCLDFWARSPRDIFGEGAGRVKRMPVNFYKLYRVPDVVTTTEMYVPLATEDVV